MTSGTVGYTDTRGNKDYTSIIASQIGKRLKQASNMASDERAFAEGQAEAGGTSLSEAGIGKGYFFGRALGNRFGGDRIARTKGRMGMGGAANNPASNYKQRFRGNFDYNITNQVSNITDTVPLSNAVITGLRGVQTGLTQVASAISRQDSTMDGLANTQADMAKAIMFNGYLFQMFMSQQKTKSGRSSANREERRIEGRGFGGGRGGRGGGFGGGGGRGMINVTPRGGSGGGRSGGSGGGGASFFTSNVLPSAGRVGSTSLSAGRGLNSIAAGAKSAKSYKALASGDIVGLMQKDGMSLYDKLGINTAEVTGDVAAKNPDSIALAAAKMLGLNADKTDSLVDFVSSGAKKGASSAKFMDDAVAAANKFPGLYQRASAGGKRILQIQTLAEQFGRKPDAISMDMMNAVMNLDDLATTQNAQRKLLSQGKAGSSNFDEYMSMTDDIFGVVAKKYGANNARQFMKLGLFGTSEGLINGADAVKDTSIIADTLMKHYPDMTYQSLEKAVLMARVGDLAESGMGSAKIVKAVRKQLGNNVADELFLKYSEDIFTNPKVAGAFAEGSGRTLLRRFLKRLPLIGLGAGLIFGIQRALEGDLVGASLEIGSGILGLTPATTGLGLMIDGYLFGRDMGLMPMAKGGTGSLSSLLGPSILNQPTLAGFAGNNAVVGGEAGKEAFIPLEGTQGEIAGSVFGEANAISFLKFLKKKPIDELRYDSEDGIDQKNPFTPGTILHKNFERMRQYDMHGLDISKNMSGVTDNNADAFKLSSQRAVNQEMIVSAPITNHYHYNGGGGGDGTTRDEVNGAPFASLDLQEYYAKMGASRRS